MNGSKDEILRVFSSSDDRIHRTGIKESKRSEKCAARIEMRILECRYTERRSSIVKEEIPIMAICRFLFGQAEEFHEGFPRLDFWSRSPYVPHLEMNRPRCSDVDEVEAIGSTSSVSTSGPLAVQVELCVFHDVVREARGHGESRTASRTRPRLEVDGAIEVTRQPDGDIRGRSRGDLKVEGRSMGCHGTALRGRSALTPTALIESGVLTTLTFISPSSPVTCIFIR